MASYYESTEKCFIFIVTLTITIFGTSFGQTISIPVPPENLCEKQSATDNFQYFDVLKMRCSPCSDQVSTTVDDSGYNCVCKRPRYRTLIDFGGDTAICEDCGEGKVVSTDGLGCVACNTTIGQAPPPCATCNNTNATAYVERNADGTYVDELKCVSCAEGFLANADNTRCEKCSKLLDPLQTDTVTPRSCACNQTNVRRVGDYCFYNDQLPSVQDREYFLKLANGEDSENSEYLVKHLEAAYALCKSKFNYTSCELLTSICAVNAGHEGSWSCQLYREDPFSRVPISNLGNWPDNLPWLYYANSETILNLPDIKTKFSLNKDSVDNTLRLFVAVYTLNGTYLGVHSVNNGRIQLCPNTQEKLNAAWSFGTAYEQTCSLYTDELNQRETLFFDPYLAYSGGLYPIPVLITNYIDANDNKVNENDDQTTWKFTRRFFLVENRLLPGSVLTYVSDMSLYVNLIKNGDGQIYPPYLKITYSVEKSENFNKNNTVTSKFTVSYELDSKKFDDDFNIALGVLGGLAFLYACIQSWTWARRSGNVSFPLVMMKFVAFMTGTLSNAFLIVLVSISVWWLVTFKRQDFVYLLPITEAQETVFKNFLIVAFVLKLFDIFHLFIQQVPVDIFLIDWERPKLQSGGGNQNEEKSESTVSIWRTYFVANEWNEIQTTRKISGMFQLIATILFLNVIGFENLCSKDRESQFKPSDVDYISPQSKMFRFGVMSAIWLVIAVIQWVGFTLIWERFVEDKVRQFVDLCSMANISVFVMENNLFGYYIHGRSPHGIADTGMKEMFRQLKRETENLCAHRGLVPNTNAQTFRMALPYLLRRKYDEVFRQLNQRGAPNTARPQGGDISEKQFCDIDANAKINKFLSDFLDHSLRDIDYVVQDKMFFESLLDAEFEQVVEKGIFYNDNGHAFDHVLFYGNELTLTTFEVLLFGLVDMTSNGGFIFSAVVVYFVSLFFQLLRDGLGRRNLAQKTLVDERFLI